MIKLFNKWETSNIKVEDKEKVLEWNKNPGEWKP